MKNVFHENLEIAIEYEQEVNKLAALNDLIKQRQEISDEDDFDTFLEKLNTRR